MKIGASTSEPTVPTRTLAGAAGALAPAGLALVAGVVVAARGAAVAGAGAGDAAGAAQAAARNASRRHTRTCRRASPNTEVLRSHRGVMSGHPSDSVGTGRTSISSLRRRRLARRAALLSPRHRRR